MGVTEPVEFKVEQSGKLAAMAQRAAYGNSAQVIVDPSLLGPSNREALKWAVGHELSHIRNEDWTTPRERLITNVSFAIGVLAFMRGRRIPATALITGLNVFKTSKSIYQESRADREATEQFGPTGAIQCLQMLQKANIEKSKIPGIGSLRYTKNGNNLLDFRHMPLSYRLNLAKSFESTRLN